MAQCFLQRGKKNGNNLILDSSKGIDKTGGFKIFKESTGTNSITKNADGTYTLLTTGGSSHQGTGLFVTTNLENAKVLIEFKIKQFNHGIFSIKVIDNSIKYISDYENQTTYKGYCEMEYNNPTNAECLDLNSTGGTNEVIITRAWLLS